MYYKLIFIQVAVSLLNRTGDRDGDSHRAGQLCDNLVLVLNLNPICFLQHARIWWKFRHPLFFPAAPQNQSRLSLPAQNSCTSEACPTASLLLAHFHSKSFLRLLPFTVAHLVTLVHGPLYSLSSPLTYTNTAATVKACSHCLPYETVNSWKETIRLF